MAHMDAYIVHQGDTLDVQMLPVKGILEEFYDVVSDGVLCGKAWNNRTVVGGRLWASRDMGRTLCPRQQVTRVEGRLFNWERESQTQR